MSFCRPSAPHRRLENGSHRYRTDRIEKSCRGIKIEADESGALRSLAFFVPATAWLVFLKQLVGLHAMIAAILPCFGHLALARSVRAFVIDLHVEGASRLPEHPTRYAQCNAGSFYEVKMRSPKWRHDRNGSCLPLLWLHVVSLRRSMRLLSPIQRDEAATCRSPAWRKFVSAFPVGPRKNSSEPT